MKLKIVIISFLLAPFLLMGQVNEKLDRGVVATAYNGHSNYVGWRLLKDDPKNIGFHVYRKTIEFSDYERITMKPVTNSTNYMDTTASQGFGYWYKIKAVINDKEADTDGEAYVFNMRRNVPYNSIRLKDGIKGRRIGIGDLNGDGAYDYVILHPTQSIGPYHGTGNWKPSESTYKLDAYDSKGKFMWRYDMGWSIEAGTWHAPFMVYDVDQDGKAEVYVKGGEGDPREPDGHVISGPEYLVKIDGETGEILQRREWISKVGFQEYHLWCRNMMDIAYLDGKNPSLLMERGTYKLIKFEALDKDLKTIWNWESRGKYKEYSGQGMHGILTGDIDFDGKDEIVYGSAALDDNGVPMWTTGLGHNDSGFIADIDPERPGYEIFYGLEIPQPKYGVNLVDAKTGKFIWAYEGSTKHVHHQGMIGDFTREYPGMECYAGEKQPDGNKFFLYSAKGERLSDKPLWGLDPRALWWDADDLKEIYYEDKIVDYDGTKRQDIEGSVIIVCDIVGDWREEIVTSLQGEIRIYSTNIVSDSRKTCLMQNHLYRITASDSPVGYYNAPQMGIENSSK